MFLYARIYGKYDPPPPYRPQHFLSGFQLCMRGVQMTLKTAEIGVSADVQMTLKTAEIGVSAEILIKAGLLITHQRFFHTP